MVFSSTRTSNWQRVNGWMGEVSNGHNDDFQKGTGGQNSTWRNDPLAKEFILSLQMSEDSIGKILPYAWYALL